MRQSTAIPANQHAWIHRHDRLLEFTTTPTDSFQLTSARRSRFSLLFWELIALFFLLLGFNHLLSDGLDWKFSSFVVVAVWIAVHPFVPRHTFKTIGGESRDQVAVNAVMGHVDSTMAGVYRERISDERLRAVVDTVHKWLFVKE